MSVSWPDWKLVNVILLGMAFLFIFVGFMTSSMAQQSVLEGAANEPNSTFHGNGYTSLSIIYLSFAFANWVAPFFVVLLGPKYSMFTSAMVYGLFVASFLHPITWVLYFGSVVLGLAASMLWVAQGNYMSLVSDATTTGRNSGIFWAILQCSLLFGNLYQYFAFRGAVEITKEKRVTFYLALTSSVAIGVIALLFLRNVKKDEEKEHTENGIVINGEGNKKLVAAAIDTFKKSFKLFRQFEMILLSITFFYSGLELTFYSGVLGTAVGHTMYFKDQAKSYIGLVGISVGLGEIVGGVGFGAFSKGSGTLRRSAVVVIGMIVHLIAFAILYLTLPPQSPLNETNEETYINPSLASCLIVAFLWGLGDSGFNTQIITILCDLYPGDSSPSAFAIMKFMQSLSAAIAFFYSSYLLLSWQLLILVITGLAGTLSFIAVDSSSRLYAAEAIHVF